MENFTRDHVMSLEIKELAEYINFMLSQGWSLNKLNQEKGIRRQTVREKLKRECYVFNKETNQFIYDESLKQKDTPTYEEVIVKSKQVKQPKIEVNQDLEERVKTLEKEMEELKTILASMKKVPQKSDKIEIINFNSKTYDRNYPFHQEVVDILEKLKADHPHLKVKDFVNTAIYEWGINLRKD